MTFTRTPRRAFGAVVALLAVGIGPAAATGNGYRVAVGGNSATAAHPMTAATTMSVNWASPTLTWTCTSATVRASALATAQAGYPVTDILRFPTFDFRGCTFPGGAMATTTAGEWQFHAEGPATSGATDVVEGHLDHISLTWRNAVCSITVSGRAAASFDEATQQLVIEESGFTGNLKTSGVLGCLGQVRNGQPINLSMRLQLTSPDGAINISGS
ncbi:MAG: hypothetical protein NTV28_03405 [Propionibacteriales bacterium]|nr:hypothetical protein [Propionibacteriales bacterium]